MERGWGAGVFNSLYFYLQHDHVLKKLPFDPTPRVGQSRSTGKIFVAAFVIPFKEFLAIRRAISLNETFVLFC